MKSAYPNATDIQDCLDDFIEQFEKGYATISKQGRLTEVGSTIFATTRECAGLAG